MLCFPIGARQGVLKVTGHGAKRSDRIGIYIIIESRRDDSVVQNITSTTEASLRDAEGIGPSLSVHSASLHTRLEHSASSGLVHQIFSA